YVDAILKIKSNVDEGMFKPIQLPAAVAFKNPDSWHLERNAEYKKRRKLVYHILDLLSCTYDKSQTGMFIWARINPEIGTCDKLADYLLYGKNIFVTPGFIFGEKGKQYIRVSLCVKQDILEKVIKRVESFDMKEI
ncbi:MAG: aminotransferase class I/II-fold pyridoxal phosphate-dependent enzyme, partial [Cyclobacteriaceae bacterium]|nr:aminotransferase class I/II-fold pyridoxal phosphate-dependent enzyme [Cyclobacteriaceae bacterium]